MSVGTIINLLRGGVFEILLMVLPILGAALVVGLIVAVLQATTSIQEQTLTFLPKFVIILLLVALLGGAMFTHLREYTINLFNMIPGMTR